MGTPWEQDVEASVSTTVASTVASELSSALSAALAAHSVAVNPHNMTPGLIGAADDNHSHADNEIPASIARDTEVTAAIATHAATPHGGGNDARLVTFTKASDQAVTGTSVTDVTGLAFAVDANATYVFSMWVDITASGGTSPTHAYQFTGPAGIDRFMAKRTQMTSATAQATTVVTALGTGFAAGATVANIKQIFEGTIRTGGTAGTVQLRVTPAGTNPTSTIARGSGGFATKVS